METFEGYNEDGHKTVEVEFEFNGKEYEVEWRRSIFCFGTPDAFEGDWEFSRVWIDGTLHQKHFLPEQWDAIQENSPEED
jgi:hypothetical protein